MSEGNRGQLVTGAILILLGVGLLALQFVEGLSEAVILFLIGGVFVAGYLYSRAYGLLIPGCILLGLGLGSVGGSSITSVSEDMFVLLGLGVGFIAIWVIPLVYEGKSIWWPLIPGIILIVVGLVEGNESLEKLLEVGWPLILVLIGLLILAGAFGLTGRKSEDEALDTEDAGQG
jgi:hypothetical protein